MALTGKLEADFGEFDTAVTKSIGNLRSFEQSGAKVEQQLNRLQLPPALATTSIDAATAVRGFAGALDQTDKALNLVGVSLGPTIGTLKELSAAANQSFTSLGALGTAGLVLATLLAAFKGTRTAGTFFGVDWDALDKKIGDSTAKLLGFGDVAGQQAAAGADVLARASQNAGREITSMAEAIEINRKATEGWQADVKRANDAIAQLHAPEEAAKQLAAWHAEIDSLKASGLLGDLTKNLDSQSFSVQQLSGWYKVSVDSIQQYGREHRAALDAAAHAVPPVTAHVADLARTLGDDLTSAARDAWSEMDRVNASIAQTQRILDELDAHKRQRDAANAAKKSQTFSTEVEALAGGRSLEDYVREAGGDVNSALIKYNADLARAKTQSTQATTTTTARPPVSPVLTRPVVPLSAGGSATTVNVTMNISGVFDPNAKRQLAQAVGDEILTRVKMGRQFGSA